MTTARVKPTKPSPITAILRVLTSACCHRFRKEITSTTRRSSSTTRILPAPRSSIRVLPFSMSTTRSYIFIGVVKFVTAIGSRVMMAATFVSRLISCRMAERISPSVTTPTRRPRSSTTMASPDSPARWGPFSITCIAWRMLASGEMKRLSMFFAMGYL